MSLLIEDLARDRIRQIERDGERARQIRQARAARRAAKTAERWSARRHLPRRRSIGNSPKGPWLR